MKKRQYAYKTCNDEDNLPKLFTNTNHVLFRSKKVATLMVDCDNANALINAINIVLTDDWFVHEASEEIKKQYLKAVAEFIEYINQLNPPLKILVVREFQANELNTTKRKPQSTHAHKMLAIFRRALRFTEVDGEYRRFLFNVCKKSRLISSLDVEPKHLAQWFGNHPWIRQSLGDDYLKLESPKRLNRSLQFSVADTLVKLLTVRKELMSQTSLYKQYCDCSKAESSPFSLAKGIGQFLDLSKSSLGLEAHNLLCVELIKPKHFEAVTRTSDYAGSIRGKQSDYPYIRPFLFDSDELSYLEQLLCYWLLCSLAIQPSDAAKFRKSNFLFQRSSRGELKFIAIKYTKSRGGQEHEPDILYSGDIVFEAINRYFGFLSDNTETIFSVSFNAPKKLGVNPFTGRQVNVQTPISLLLRLWNNGVFYEGIKSTLNSLKTDTVLVDAMLTLFSRESVGYEEWIKQKGKEKDSYSDYMSKCPYSRPQSMFGGSQIKSTSVYSNSDLYRDNDLINYNSHSSLTEKVSYLNDSNKEWVNQVGRISRLVMDDIEQHAFAPSLNIIETEAHLKSIHTTVKAATGVDNVSVNSIGIELIEESGDWESITIIESESNAISMMHYIEQASLMYRKLNDNSATYLEKILINVEWMNYCLDKFDPKTVSLASIRYKNIKEHLPRLFTNEVSGGIGI